MHSIMCLSWQLDPQALFIILDPCGTARHVETLAGNRLDCADYSSETSGYKIVVKVKLKERKKRQVEN